MHKESLRRYYKMKKLSRSVVLNVALRVVWFYGGFVLQFSKNLIEKKKISTSDQINWLL